MTWAQATVEIVKLLKDLVLIVVVGAVSLLFILRMP